MNDLEEKELNNVSQANDDDFISGLGENAPEESFDSDLPEELPADNDLPELEEQDYQEPEQTEEPVQEDPIEQLEELTPPTESMSDVVAQTALESDGEEPSPEEETEEPKPEKVKKEKVKKEKAQKAEKPKKEKKADNALDDEIYGFKLAKGERFIKDYNFVNTGKKGLAIVTNKRFIIKTNYTIETAIDSITGVKSCKFTQFKALKFIFGLIFMGICGTAFALKLPQMFADKLWLAYLLMGLGGLFGLIGFIMVCTSFKKKFALNIFTRDMIEFATFHSAMGKREAQNYVQVIEAVPGKEFNDFTKEIGSLLLDIKNGLYD